MVAGLAVRLPGALLLPAQHAIAVARQEQG